VSVLVIFKRPGSPLSAKKARVSSEEPFSLNCLSASITSTGPKNCRGIVALPICRYVDVTVMRLARANLRAIEIAVAKIPNQSPKSLLIGAKTNQIDGKTSRCGANDDIFAICHSL